MSADIWPDNYGSANVLEALRALENKTRLILPGSGEEYGCVWPEELPVREEQILKPVNIYAATKVCQNMIGTIYAKAYGLDIVMTRAFNHVGPDQAGETYNIGSGQARSIREILQTVIKKSSADIQVEVDKKKLRPIDMKEIRADIQKIQKITGWKPKICLEQTIQDTLDYWRTHFPTQSRGK